MKVPISIILLVLVLAGCATIHKGPGAVYVAHDRTSLSLSANIQQPGEIALPQRGFTIVAPKIDDDVAIQVCASTNRKIIDQVKVGENIANHPCFAVGTGMAMPAALPPLYSVPLYIDAGDAHNYYSVERRSTSRDAATIVSVNDVSNIDETPLAPTYLVVVIDKNKNKTLDVGEFWVTKVIWK